MRRQFVGNTVVLGTECLRKTPDGQPGPGAEWVYQYIDTDINMGITLLVYSSRIGAATPLGVELVVHHAMAVHRAPMGPVGSLCQVLEGGLCRRTILPMDKAVDFYAEHGRVNIDTIDFDQSEAFWLALKDKMYIV